MSHCEPFGHCPHLPNFVGKQQQIKEYFACILFTHFLKKQDIPFISIQQQSTKAFFPSKTTQNCHFYWKELKTLYFLHI